jgi:NAD(P)-dependent dehydrogenase (short-subunit alcohol dehydrogenase family)
VREDGIDVNAIAPGALNTRLLDEVLASGPERVGAAFFDRALKQKEEGGAPLTRGADLAVVLASAESDGLTGRLLSAVWDPWERLDDRREALAGSDVYTLRRIVPRDRGFDWDQ